MDSAKHNGQKPGSYQPGIIAADPPVGTFPDGEGATAATPYSEAPASASQTRPLDGVAARPRSTIREFFERFARQSSVPANVVTEPAEQPGGIREITRTTNYWFDREVGVLERDARGAAAELAAKGLPHHDVARGSPLELEQFLAGRCVESFRQWVDHVRVRMTDAIAKKTELIGGFIVALRAATGRIEQLESEIATIDRRVNELRTETKVEGVRVGFEPIAPSKIFFWFFAVSLTLVEFFANFPVFRLLLPMKAALARAADAAAQQAIAGGWLSGFALQMKEIPLHADAFVVAFVAVLVLVLFGKTLGVSLRVLVALRPKEQPLASTTIVSIRRQHWAAFLLCLAGLVAVLAFLFFSRASIASVAAGRVATDSLQLERLLKEAAQVRGDFAAVSLASRRVQEQTRTLDLHRDDSAYAMTVQNNNRPLFLLNAGLALAAALLGFLTHRQVASDGTGEHPTIIQLRAERRSHQQEAHAMVQLGRMAESDAEAGFVRAEHLMTARPLAEWQAKAVRLRGVLLLFRGENARLRGLDSASILAFASPPTLSLPTLGAESGFPEPTSFACLKKEFDVCRRDFGAVTRRLPINSGDL